MISGISNFRIEIR